MVEFRLQIVPLFSPEIPTEITIIWTPPRDNQILVRGYTIGWGKGIPDEYTKVVDDKQRYFVIESLSKFILSIYY